VHPDTISVPTARQAAALFLKREEKLTEEQQAYLERLQQVEVGKWRQLTSSPRSLRE
jgi:hypothetical protein